MSDLVGNTEDSFSRVSAHMSPYNCLYMNKNIKVSSFKSSENIQKKEGGPDTSVSDNQSS